MSNWKDEPELCFNFWYIVDGRAGTVGMLLARAYALVGNDDHKKRVLQSLALSDYITARKFAPATSVQTAFGTLNHTTTRQMVESDVLATFEPFFQEVDREPYRWLVFEGTEGVVRQLSMQKAPLYVMTALIDDSQGRLIPVAADGGPTEAEWDEIEMRLGFSL